jgi:hypothetical protein
MNSLGVFAVLVMLSLVELPVQEMRTDYYIGGS